MVSGTASSLDSALGTVLGGNAFYLKAFACQKHDMSMYNQLMNELGDEFKDRWMKGGTKSKKGVFLSFLAKFAHFEVYLLPFVLRILFFHQNY